MKTRRKKRLRKKLHKSVLWEMRDFVSLDAEWRRCLFDSEPGQVFVLTWENLPSDRYYRDARQTMRRYDLRFSVCTVPQEELPFNIRYAVPHCIAFKFYAPEFPGVRDFSNNNAEVRE